MPYGIFVKKFVSEPKAFFLCSIENEVDMVIHKAECQDSYLTPEAAYCYNVHGCYECRLILKEYVCTKSIREQMVESFLSHIYISIVLTPLSPSPSDFYESQEMTLTKIDILWDKSNFALG